ncbi:MAG: ANTAR domain-containing protein [Lachnospiraceae bacterium]|nr:ANTAR domain-containing protein [Lachnospiraceae bacterium]
MTGLIVLFGRPEEAHGIHSLLIRNGYDVAASCTLGAQALNEIHNLESGILICGYKYPDMVYTDLMEELPDSFEMLLMAPQGVIMEERLPNVVALSMPVKAGDFISTIGMMISEKEQRRRQKRNTPSIRSEKEKALIDHAKALLMDRNHMSEADAHRYLQKRSMNNGTGIVETAQMILALLDE